MARIATQQGTSGRRSSITSIALIASATLTVETRGEGFVEITRDVAGFLLQIGAADGVLLAYIRHTSASLVIQENADPDVQVDLATALDRLAPPMPAGCTMRKAPMTCQAT